MRKKIRPAFIVIIFAAFIGLLILNRPRFEEHPVKTKQNPVQIETQALHNLDKPIIDISGWQRPSEINYDILSKNPSVNLEDKKGYIRLEKIRFKRETEEDILLNGTIIDTEFSGVNVRYTIQVSENQIVNVTRIDSQFAIKSVGENVELYITPSDIVQY